MGVFITLSLPGCGTIASHAPPRTGQPLPATSTGHYRGVRWDIGLIKDVYIFTPYYLADIPGSFIADTVLFQFDSAHNPVNNTIER